MIDLREFTASAVPLEMLRRYLAATGWHVRNPVEAQSRPDDAVTRVLLDGRTSGKRNFEIYISGLAGFEGIELVVPNDVRSSEYAGQVSRVVDALAALEDRSEDDVVRAIREIAFDVVRSCIPDPQVFNESIRLEAARSFVVGIRNVLASAATTELQPRPYFLRQKKEATEYADRCRFGHTFRGSFGFTVESPLQPNDQITLFGTPPPPFERRVIQRFARGLQLVSAAVSADSTAPIIQSTGTGFSANVCEQLASLVEQTSQSGMAFDFSFSPEWPSENVSIASHESPF